MKRLSGTKAKKMLFLLFAFLLSFSITFNSCKKDDTTIDPVEREQAAISSKFFSVKADTYPVVKRIVAEIIKRNNSKEFVTGFAAKNGYPVWDKAIIKMAKNKNPQSFANTAATNDTLVFIPLVMPDSNTVNGYILANINPGINLSYCLAKDYKAYSFAPSSSQITADAFTATMMLLQKQVFGTTAFKLTDDRLFQQVKTDSGGHTNHRTINVNDEISTAQNFLVYQEFCIISSWICQECHLSSCSFSGTSRDCILYQYEVGGSGDGSGGTSGSGGGIPPAYPCNPNLPQSFGEGGQLPPCPAPGPGTGWVPAPLDKLCSTSLNFREGNDHSYWETYVTQLKFESSNSVNTFSAYYYLPNDISDNAMNAEIYPSPFGPGVPPKSAYVYLSDFFPDLFQSDIQRIWDSSINSYVWRFSKYAAQIIASRCSNIAAQVVSTSPNYGSSVSTPYYTAPQIDFRATTKSYLRCFLPTTSTDCRISPSTSTNTSVANYSPLCN